MLLWEVCYIYPFSTIYVISEGEEGVRADSYSLQGADPVLLFSFWQELRHFVILRLPYGQVWALSTQNTRNTRHFVNLAHFVIRCDVENQSTQSRKKDCVYLKATVKWIYSNRMSTAATANLPQFCLERWLIQLQWQATDMENITLLR